MEASLDGQQPKITPRRPPLPRFQELYTRVFNQNAPLGTLDRPHIRGTPGKVASRIPDILRPTQPNMLLAETELQKAVVALVLSAWNFGIQTTKFSRPQFIVCDPFSEGNAEVGLRIVPTLLSPWVLRGRRAVKRVRIFCLLLLVGCSNPRKNHLARTRSYGQRGFRWCLSRETHNEMDVASVPRLSAMDKGLLVSDRNLGISLRVQRKDVLSSTSKFQVDQPASVQVFSTCRPTLHKLLFLTTF